MTVAIMPGLLMTIGAAGRHQPIKDLGQVMYQARLKFNRTDHRRATDIEYMHDPVLNLRFPHNPSDQIRQILHVPMTTSGNFQPFSERLHIGSVISQTEITIPAKGDRNQGELEVILLQTAG